MLNFNFQKFEENLKKYEVTEQNTSDAGLAQVIKYVWNHYPTASINFDAFSFNDITEALDWMRSLPSNDEDDEVLTPQALIHLRINPWLINYMLESAVANLCRTKNKVYVNDDDFI